MLAGLSGQDAPPPLEKLAAPGTQGPPAHPVPGIEVQDSGPIHEAFAQPDAPVKGRGLLAPKAPPPPVPELPPETKPDGDNIVWVPGYWYWDEPKKDFTWMSGFWRNAPEGREWQPGEWVKEGSGWRYASGHWKKSNTTNFQRNLPKPPESVEAGPSTPSPTPDAVWVPGHWEYRVKDYAWRGGYWGLPEAGSLWTPPQYLWTPTGYTYVSGYWDYCLEDRGLLYAPVYFTRPLWQTPGWCYRPSFAINIGLGGGWGWGWGDFYSSLFIGPSYNCFYYGSRYSNWWCWGLGYRPWYYHGRGYYNHLYHHYAYLNRNNAHWASNLRSTYASRAIGVDQHRSRTRGGVVPENVVRGDRRDLGGRNPAVTGDARNARPAGTSLVQPAKQVLASQQAARRIEVRPGGVTRVPGTQAANGANRVDNTMTRRTFNEAPRGNITTPFSRDSRTTAAAGGRGTLPGEGTLGRPVERFNSGMPRGDATLRRSEGFDFNRGSRTLDVPSTRGGIERSAPNSRGLELPDLGGRGIPGGRGTFNPPASGRNSFGGSMGSGIGGRPSGGFGGQGAGGFGGRSAGGFGGGNGRSGGGSHGGRR